MTWKVDHGLSIGYKNRPVATVNEQILFEAGQITLLLGLNGQGKTTLMKTLDARAAPSFRGFHVPRPAKNLRRLEENSKKSARPH